jgi:glycosyltransferase involved in cell wall biosynthesis
MKASVIIPVFNAGAYLHESLDSVFCASDHSVEIVCVDDCSEDNSHSILCSYQLTHPNLRVFRNSKNLGVTLTLIKAIAYSTNELLIRHDADDIMAPNRISYIRRSLSENPNNLFFGCCLTGVLSNNDQLLSFIRTPTSKKAFLEAMSSFSSPCAHGSIFFSKCLYNQVGGYNSRFPVAQDFAFYISILGCKTAEYIPIESEHPLYYHRITPNSVTARTWRRKLFIKYEMLTEYRRNKISPTPYLDYAIFFLKSLLSITFFSFYSPIALNALRSEYNKVNITSSSYLIRTIRKLILYVIHGVNALSKR